MKGLEPFCFLFLSATITVFTTVATVLLLLEVVVFAVNGTLLSAVQ